MKYFKKFASAALALVMVLALAVPAFASAGTKYAITIDKSNDPDHYNQNSNHEYEAYQIFKGDISFDVTYKYEDEEQKEHTVTVTTSTQYYVDETKTVKFPVAEGVELDVYITKVVKQLNNIEWGDGIKDDDEDKSGAVITALQDKYPDDEALWNIPKAEEGGQKTRKSLTAADIAKWLSADTDKDNAKAKAFADIVGTNVTSTKHPQTDVGTKTQNKLDENGKPVMGENGQPEQEQVVTSYVIGNLDAGYYLVQDSKEPSGAVDPAGNDSYTRFVMEVVGNVQTEAKASAPTVKKNIVETVTTTTPPADPNGEPTTTTTEEEKKVNEAAIGDSVKYRIEGTMPSTFDDYKTYYYKFSDNLSKGLTYNYDMKVYLVYDVTVKNADGSETTTTEKVDVTDQFTITPKNEEKPTGENYDPTAARTESTAITVEHTNVKSLANISAAAKIVLEYSATLNKGAEIGGTTGNPNDVKLSYSNDPNHSNGSADDPKGETPKSEVTTFTTELTITKTDENGDILTGAGFTLSGKNLKVVLSVASETFVEDKDGAYWMLKPEKEGGDPTYTTVEPNEETQGKYDSTEKKYKKVTVYGTEHTKDATTDGTISVTATVDDKGNVTFAGLGEGEYTITESTTPTGYNTISPITFKISFDEDTKKFSTDNSAIALEVENTLGTTIINQTGSRLPSTGGIGTTIFYIVGGVLVLGAVVLLITKRRASADDE